MMYENLLYPNGYFIHNFIKQLLVRQIKPIIFISPLMHRRNKVFIGASATKSFEKSRIFRYKGAFRFFK